MTIELYDITTYDNGTSIIIYESGGEYVREKLVRPAFYRLIMVVPGTGDRLTCGEFDKRVWTKEGIRVIADKLAEIGGIYEFRKCYRS